MSNVIITFLASFLIWFLFAGLLVLWVIDGRIKKEQATHAIFAFIVAWGLSQLIKTIFPTLRPFEINGGSALTLFTIGGAFPSSHTAAAFAVSVTIWLHDKKIGTLYLLSAFLIGVARVIGNVHYPIDILGGAVLGSLVAIVFEKVHFKNLTFSK